MLCTDDIVQVWLNTEINILYVANYLIDKIVSFLEDSNVSVLVVKSIKITYWSYSKYY